MSISEMYRAGLQDMFLGETNTPVLLQLARSITKNVCKIEEPEEALNYIMAHGEDIHKLLHKRHITKEFLFKYLHNRLPGTSTDFTKADLIMRVLQYWAQQLAPKLDSERTDQQLPVVNCGQHGEQDYPIHLMARKFGEWFFYKLNENTLKAEDIWQDAALQLRVMADDGVSDVECATATDVVESFNSVKQQFSFYFNPNLSHSGIQGRIDPYGHVVVLCCGTLHSEQRSVGVFESAFGLLRDPHAGNNWKPKMFKCLLRSKLSPPDRHMLKDSETLTEALSLPATNEELD